MLIYVKAVSPLNYDNFYNFKNIKMNVNTRGDLYLYQDNILLGFIQHDHVIIKEKLSQEYNIKDITYKSMVNGLMCCEVVLSRQLSSPLQIQP